MQKAEDKGAPLAATTEDKGTKAGKSAQVKQAKANYNFRPNF